MRETGPKFPLFVVVCKEHNLGFTLYPPGYYPYSRQTLAPVSADGRLLAEKTDEHRFSTTLFAAPLEAAAGNVWLQESVAGSMQPRRTTQKRHLERIARLFGFGEDGNARHREEVSQILMVSGQLLHDCSTLLATATALKTRGRIITKILNRIPLLATIFERLAEIGAGARLWQPPLFCRPGVHGLHPSPFHPVRTRGAPEKKWG